MNRPQYSLVTAPAQEPVTYAECSAHLRVDSEEDAAYIEALIPVAREHVEAATGRSCLQSTWRVIAPSWHSLITGDDRDVTPWLRMPYVIPLYRSPLVSVTHVKYYAPDATTLTTMSSNDYRVCTDCAPGFLQLTGDIPALDDRPDAIQIDFVAGHGRAIDSPPGVRHAIKLLVAHLYEERKPLAFATPSALPFSLQSLIQAAKVKGDFA